MKIVTIYNIKRNDPGVLLALFRCFVMFVVNKCTFCDCYFVSYKQCIAKEGSF